MGKNGISHSEAVPAFPFGAIEGGISGLEQILFVGAMMRHCSHADRSCDKAKRAAIVHDNQFPKCCANALGAGFGSMQIGGRQDHDELFAAIAADEILGANTAHKKCAGLAQDRIASFMAIGIVEILEVIQIE